MTAFRRLLAQRRLATWLCAATLLLKLLVPGGYMVGGEHGRLAITPCSGIVSRPMATAMPGMHDGMPDHGKPKDHGKADMPCAFSALAAVALGAIDPIQLAALIAFVIAGPYAALSLAPVRHSYLRPPSRGPPATL